MSKESQLEIAVRRELRKREERDWYVENAIRFSPTLSREAVEEVVDDIIADKEFLDKIHQGRFVELMELLGG